MRKTWPIVAAVVALGLLAGVAIAGRPAGSDDFVIDTSIPANTSTAPTTPGDAAGSVPVTDVATTSPTTVEPAEVAPTTTSSTTTTPATTSTTTVPARPLAEVRVVVANGAAQGGVASSTAAELRAIGYSEVTATNALRTVPTSTIYFRPGFEREAARLAVDIGRPDIAIVPLPDNARVSQRDDAGDLVLVLGIDIRS